MHCPKCSAEVNQQAKFCWQCGATIAPGTSLPAAPAQRNPVPWITGGVAFLAIIIALLAYAGAMRGKVTTAPGEVRPSAPVTASPPANATPPVTELAPGNVTPDPDAASVAEYLRKLDVIQRRDAQNPMEQLAAVAAKGLLDVMGSISDTQGGEPAEGRKDANKPPDYRPLFERILKEKQDLLSAFRSISPVPAPCQNLHALFGRYLDAQVDAITKLRDMVAQPASPTAPLSVQPIEAARQAAYAGARAEEDAIRQRYHIPRAYQPLAP